jgi:hypothetical protein
MARRKDEGDTAVLDREDEQSTDETPDTESEASTETATDERDSSGDTVHTDGEVEADLAPFQQSAQAGVAQRDTSTGDLPEGTLEPVLEAYRNLPSTKDRNRAKNWLKDQMKDAMAGMDLSLARAFLTLSESMTTSHAKAPVERRPADPLAAWRSNLLTSTIAYGELAGSAKPEEGNVEEITSLASSTEVVDEINAYRAWLDTEVGEDEERPEAPGVRPEVVQAFRLVRGSKRRAAGGGTSTPHDGPRRDLGKHIEAAFADVKSGDFLSVAEIRKFRSEEYGDEQPSAGAISARLFPSKGECTVEGIRPGTGGEKGTKGAYKI